MYVELVPYVSEREKFNQICMSLHYAYAKISKCYVLKDHYIGRSTREDSKRTLSR